MFVVALIIVDAQNYTSHVTNYGN